MPRREYKKLTGLTLTSLALSALLPLNMPTASASSLLEEVVVTAQKREENLQDVPISIAAFSGDALKEMGADTISDLGKATAGVEMNNETVTQPVYNIRGIQTADFTVGSDPAVAVYIDGVYSGRGAGAEMSFDDVQRVEILKGPQGTLYGRNATGGAIHIITKKPDFEAETNLGLTVGDYGRIDLEGSTTGPLTETLAYRVSATSSRRDGFQSNQNGPDQSGIDSKSFRGSLLWTPSDDLEVILRAEYSDLNQNSGGVHTTTESVYNAGNTDGNLDIFGDVSFDGQNTEERDMFGSSVEVNYHMDDMTLTSITAYRSMNVGFLNDEDGSSDPGHLFHSDGIDDQDQMSQEFRLTGEQGKLKWTVGLGYSVEHVDHTTIAEFNYSTFENFAIYEGLRGDPNALAALGITAADLGIDADSGDQAIAEVINGARAQIHNNGLDGITISNFLADLYSKQADPTGGAGGSGNYGALHGLDARGGCGGLAPISGSIGEVADNSSLTNAMICGIFPQVSSQITNNGMDRWIEDVRNTGTYQSSAIYGDFTYALTEKMNISAGLRYTYDKKEFTVDTGYRAENSFLNATAAQGGGAQPLGLAFYNGGLDLQYVRQTQQEDWEAISGRFVVDYFLSDDSMMYGSIATGFKSGGFNSLSFAPGIEASFPQEEVINYELGYKGDWLEGKLRLNAAAYFYEYENLQELSLVGAPIPSYNLRTADAEGQGIDVDVLWSITDQLFIASNYSYLDTEYTGYQVLEAAGETEADDKTGSPRANTPKNKFNLMAEYLIELDSLGSLALRADYNWTDERVSQLPDENVDAYSTWNTRATLTSADDTWSTALWVKNLTNEDIIGDYTGPATAIGSHTIWRYAPRMIGLDLAIRFQ